MHQIYFSPVIAADWLNQGLMDIGEAEVVSPFTVRTHKDAIGILGNDSQGRPSFAQLTGAQNLITGNFYKEKEELIFKLELVNALEGKLRFGFDAIRGQETDKEALITQLREQVTGYWVAREMVDAKKINAPNFKAYELYLSELQLKRPSNKTLIEIIRLDSTFYFPRIFFTHTNGLGVFGDNKPHFEFLDRHFSSLSNYEKTWLNSSKSLYLLGNPVSVFNNMNDIRIKYPKDYFLNLWVASIAQNSLNNSELAIEIFKKIPIESIQPKELGRYYNILISEFVNCLLRLNKIEEANTFLATVQPMQEVENYANYVQSLMFTAIRNKNEVMVESAFSQLKTAYSFSSAFYFNNTFSMLESNLLTEQLRIRIEDDIKTNIEQLNPKSIEWFLWNNVFASLEKNADNIRLDNLDQMPVVFQLVNLFYAGRLFIESDLTEQVNFVLEELQKHTSPNYSIMSAHGCATAFYYIAKLQTQMGQYDSAIENLKQARALGKHTGLHNFEYDRHLAPLYDLPAFQEIIKSIWPVK